MMTLRKIDKFSILIAAIFGTLSMIAYTGGFNQFEFRGFPYTVPLAKPSSDPGFTGYGYDYDGPLLLDHDPPIPFGRLTLTLKASALSSQNPISVNIKIHFDEKTVSPEFREKYYLGKESLAIVFPNAYKYDWFGLTKKYHAFIAITPTSEPNNFEGSGTIVYPFEGKYGYMFMTTEDMTRLTEEDGGFNLSKVAYRIQNNTIPVESASVTASIQTNNIFLALTFIATAIGSIQILHHYFNKPY